MVRGLLELSPSLIDLVGNCYKLSLHGLQASRVGREQDSELNLPMVSL